MLGCLALYRTWAIRLEPHYTLFNAIFVAKTPLDELEELITKDITLLEERDAKDRGPVEISSTYGYFELERLILNFAPSKAEVICLGEKILFGACAKGHLESVKMLYERHSDAINNFRDEEISAIAVASENGHLDIVQFLSALGEGEPDDEGRYSMFNLRWIFEYDADRIEILEFALSSPRRVAALKRDFLLDTLNMLLETATSSPQNCRWVLTNEKVIADFDTINLITKHAHRVAWPHPPVIDPEVLQMLVDICGIDLKTLHFPQLKDGSLLTVALGIWLRNPTAEHCKEAFVLLASLGLDVNIRFHCVGISPNPSMIDGADGRFDRPDESEGPPKITPLILAARYGNLEAVQLLVELGANDLDPEFVGNPGSSALYHAIAEAKENGEDAAIWIAKSMEARGSLFKVVSSRLVLACFHFGAPAVASLLLRNFPRFLEHRVDSLGVTLLDISLRSNQVSTAKWMLCDSALPVSWKTHYTAGTFAICLGKRHIEAIQFILESRAEIANNIALETYDLPTAKITTLELALNLHGTPVAHVAHLMFAEIAKEAPEKLSASFPNALRLGLADFVTLYAAHNAIDWTKVDEEGYNWLMQFTLTPEAEYRTACLQALIDAAGSENIEYANAYGDTALQLAVLAGKDVVVAALLRAGASPNRGESPAHFKFYEQLALSRDPALPEELKLTPIHCALYSRRIRTIRAVLQVCGPSAFHRSHVNVFIRIPGHQGIELFLETIFPDFVPKVDSESESLEFDEDTRNRVRLMYLSAVNANNWHVIHYLAIERKFASLVPEYYFPDLRMEFKSSTPIWIHLYDAGIVGKCLNASVEVLNDLRENDPWFSSLPPMVVYPIYNLGVLENLSLIKAMYARGANFQRQYERQPHFITGLGDLPSIKWLMSKGFNYYLHETTVEGHPNFDALQVNPTIKQDLISLHNLCK